jgi:hypothetical protein
MNSELDEQIIAALENESTPFDIPEGLEFSGESGELAEVEELEDEEQDVQIDPLFYNMIEPILKQFNVKGLGSCLDRLCQLLHQKCSIGQVYHVLEKLKGIVDEGEIVTLVIYMVELACIDAQAVLSIVQLLDADLWLLEIRWCWVVYHLTGVVAYLDQYSGFWTSFESSLNLDLKGNIELLHCLETSIKSSLADLEEEEVEVDTEPEPSISEGSTMPNTKICDLDNLAWVMQFRFVSMQINCVFDIVRLARQWTRRQYFQTSNVHSEQMDLCLYYLEHLEQNYNIEPMFPECLIQECLHHPNPLESLEQKSIAAHYAVQVEFD